VKRGGNFLLQAKVLLKFNLSDEYSTRSSSDSVSVSVTQPRRLDESATQRVTADPVQRVVRKRKVGHLRVIPGLVAQLPCSARMCSFSPSKFPLFFSTHSNPLVSVSCLFRLCSHRRVATPPPLAPHSLLHPRSSCVTQSVARRTSSDQSSQAPLRKSATATR